MQAKRDFIWTTIGWSFIGNIFGILMVKYLETTSQRWKNLKNFRKSEVLKIGGFLGTIGMFTYYGYAKGRQEFVRQKIEIVK
jgi:hypothetical protein